MGIYTSHDKPNSNLTLGSPQKNSQDIKNKLNEDKNTNTRFDVYSSSKLCTTRCTVYTIYV